MQQRCDQSGAVRLYLGLLFLGFSAVLVYFINFPNYLWIHCFLFNFARVTFVFLATDEKKSHESFYDLLKLLHPIKGKVHTTKTRTTSLYIHIFFFILIPYHIKAAEQIFTTYRECVLDGMTFI